MATKGVPRHILLTGVPGVGKTTLVQKVCQSLQAEHVPVQGFYTGELREHGKRIGFDVMTLDGQKGALARVQSDDHPGASRGRTYKVGQYSVQLQSFETTAIPTLRHQAGSKQAVYVIDEIGKMELFSDSFKTAVQKLFDLPNTTVLCTIPVPKGKPLPFVDQIRKRQDAILIEVTRNNRDNILKDVVQAIVESMKTYKT